MLPADLRDYAEPAVLRDGGSILIRALRPSDKPLLIELIAGLSPESMRFRFLAAKSTLTTAELAYLTEVDFSTHVALVGVLRRDGAEHLVGVGRYFRVGPTGDAPGRAEVAFTVADEHQGRGIGTLLLEHLARIARARGVDTFEAEVLADNEQMLEVFATTGLPARRSIEAGVYHVSFPTRSTEAFVQASLARERQAAGQSVRVFFEPASVAVVGPSRSGGIGRAILDNLVRCKFHGPIYAVNPRATEIAGVACYPSVTACPGPVDLAVIAVPAPAVEAAVADCAAARARGVVVISAGFAEVSAEGRTAQDRLRQLVRSSGMRMVGPNCMGVLNADRAVALNATFAPSWPPAGNISIASQSGALGLAMLDHAVALDLGIAGFVSLGNKADVSGNDLLSYWADDPHTAVIALYLESFGNPRKFGRVAPEVARRKPIVAIKSGRSAAGSRAASSHSAALASVDVSVDALFAQAGVIRTNTLEEMFDVVAMLSSQPAPAGPRVGVVTNAGGPGILLADACEAHGLSLPPLSERTLSELRSFLPAQAGLANPIDMIASATPEQYARTIELVGNDPAIDALVVIYIPPLVTAPEEIAAAIARAGGTVPAHKPLASVFMSSRGTPAILSSGARGRIPSYSFPENAALALAAARRHAVWRERPLGQVFTFDADLERRVQALVERARAGATAPVWLAPGQVAELLELAGIPLARGEQAPPDPDRAVEVAERLGYPLVAKAVAPGLIHKTDIGGVILHLDSAAAVREAAATLIQRMQVAGLRPGGILLQRQVDDGIEALVGVTSDPSMGPLLAVGLGGVQVELLRDVAFRLTPVSDLEAAAMLDELRTGKLLDGYRGSAPADRAALVDVVRRVAALVEAAPPLLDLELNPVRVRRPGQGAIAVDARIRVAAP